MAAMDSIKSPAAKIPPAPRPAPLPAAGNAPATEQATKPAPDPTRYGDWEIKGRCIDF